MIFPSDEGDTDHGPILLTSPYSTSKAKRKNRIWCAGTPSTGMKAARGTSSQPGLVRVFENQGPEMRLPSLEPSTSSLAVGQSLGGGRMKRKTRNVRGRIRTQHQCPKEMSVGTSRKKTRPKTEKDERDAKEEEVYDSDSPSMSLKDLLLTSRFDL